MKIFNADGARPGLPGSETREGAIPLQRKGTMSRGTQSVWVSAIYEAAFSKVPLMRQKSALYYVCMDPFHKLDTFLANSNLCW